MANPTERRQRSTRAQAREEQAAETAKEEVVRELAVLHPRLAQDPDCTNRYAVRVTRADGTEADLAVYWGASAARAWSTAWDTLQRHGRQSLLELGYFLEVPAAT
jgi:hypothetical protein